MSSWYIRTHKIIIIKCVGFLNDKYAYETGRLCFCLIYKYHSAILSTDLMANKLVNEESLEKKLWKAADKLRKNMDAAEYKHIVLGLIFLKYISDAFEELYQKLKDGKGVYEGADPADKNEYTAEKVFYVPPSSRWEWLQGRAKLPTIGKDVDDAMDAIEKDNPSLRGVLPKVYAQEKLDKQNLGGLIDLVGSAALGTKEAQSKDVLGKVYEYFLGEFALAEGKKGTARKLYGVVE